jgi:threonyl-tRNA synthetase
MRLLMIHSDYIEFAALEPAVKEPEKIEGVGKPKRVEECLVTFCSVEKCDEESPQKVAEKAVKVVLEQANMLKVRRIALYPYSHLSSDLSSPAIAMKVLTLMEGGLRAETEVTRAPFGWYKTFELRCKGHPLGELARSVTLDSEEAEVKAEDKTPQKPSTFIVLTPDGTEHAIDLSAPKTYASLKIEPPLLQLIKNEAGVKGEREAPAHIRLMKKLELVDYEPASDIGHFRFYPKGMVVKDSLEEFAYDIAVKDLKACKIETPYLYRTDEPDIAEQASKFREKDYRLMVDKKEFTLRFAGDFGLFRMMKGATMSYRQLPVRVYELSPSFRLEQSGECVGLKRLRNFTMPDLHCFCRNLDQGTREYTNLFEKYTKLTNSMEIEYAVAFRVVKDFYDTHKEWFASLLKICNKPALIELLPEMKHYWVLKHEYQAIDADGGNMQLVTVQLDVEDAARYGIFYTDEDGQKKGCIILHSSLGSIERWIASVLEQASRDQQKGKVPKLPVWLSPVQVRVVPVNNTYVDMALSMAQRLAGEGVRADVDDREESVSKKVRDAEVEWTPFIVVVGEKEATSEKLIVRVRGGSPVEVAKDGLVALVGAQTVGKPKVPSYTPMLLSMRPRFG